jgi:hypothetical protein
MTLIIIMTHHSTENQSIQSKHKVSHSSQLWKDSETYPGPFENNTSGNICALLITKTTTLCYTKILSLKRGHQCKQYYKYSWTCHKWSQTAFCKLLQWWKCIHLAHYSNFLQQLIRVCSQLFLEKRKCTHLQQTVSINDL